MLHTTWTATPTDKGSLGNDRPGQGEAFYMRNGWERMKLYLEMGNRSDGTLQPSTSVQTNMVSTVMGVHYRPLNHEEVEHRGLLHTWKKPHVCRLQLSW